MNNPRHSQQQHKSHPPSPTPGARPGPTRHATTQGMFPPQANAGPRTRRPSTYLIHPSGLHALCETSQLRYTACASLSPFILPRKKESRCRPRVPCATNPWLVARQVLFLRCHDSAIRDEAGSHPHRLHGVPWAAGDIVVFLSPAGMSVVVDMSMWFDVSDRGLCSQRAGKTHLLAERERACR